jgi:hypothetical protein
VAALHRLSASGPAGGGAGAGGWCAQVYQGAHALLSSLVGSRHQQAQQQQQWRAAVALFTVGEVGLLRAAKVPGSLTLLVQALTSDKLLPGAGAGGSEAPSCHVGLASQVRSALWTAPPCPQPALNLPSTRP